MPSRPAKWRHRQIDIRTERLRRISSADASWMSTSIRSIALRDVVWKAWRLASASKWYCVRWCDSASSFSFFQSRWSLAITFSALEEPWRCCVGKRVHETQKTPAPPGADPSYHPSQSKRSKVSLWRNLFVWPEAFRLSLQRMNGMAVSADGFQFERTTSVSAAEQHFPATTDSATKWKVVLAITSGSTDLFFAAGEALGGDVAVLQGEDKSERSVTAFKSPAGVSVLNPEGGTCKSSSGSALLFSAWKSVNCPGGLRLGAGALILKVRHRLVQPRQKV